MTEEERNRQIIEWRKQRPSRAEFIAELREAGLKVSTFAEFVAAPEAASANRPPLPKKDGGNS